MKTIAFVGMMHFFKCTVPRQLPGFKIYEINVTYEYNDPSRYQACLDLNEKEKIDYWVFFRGEYVPQEIMCSLQGKKINISTEPLGREDIQRMYLGANKPFFLEHFKQFDYFTHYDFTEINDLKIQGFNVDSAFALPVDIDTYQPQNLKKLWDVVFLGRGTIRRNCAMSPIKKDFNVLHIDNGCFDQEAVRVYNMSKIGLNMNVAGFPQNQHRVFNMMACGLPIISDKMSHTDWLKPDDEKYFEFMTDLDGISLYKKVQSLLEDTSIPLKMRGQISRRIAVNQFNASKNWARLIEKVEMKK